MKTIKRTEIYNAPDEKVFSYIDDLGVPGMHMTQSSAMMMGSKLHLEFLTKHHTGIGSKYQWTGTMMGIWKIFVGHGNTFYCRNFHGLVHCNTL